jgi:hypothetical protein
MDIKKFIDSLAGKVKLRKGKEEYLYSTVSKYGHCSPEAEKAI